MKVFLGLIFALSFTLTPARADSSIDTYSKLFPLFMEYCAATQIKPLFGEEGGFGGHAVIYVHGLCKNENIDYPRVEACSRIPLQKHVHSGVGISVDKYFKNVNWVAVPGYDFFISGGLNATEKLTDKSLERLIAETVELGIFKGVIYDEKQLGRELLEGDKKHGSHFYEEGIANSAVGTNMALQWGRNVECIRLPITEPQLYAVRDYLNRLNEKYYQNPQKPYNWSAYSNNCTHTSSNAFSAIGAKEYIEPETNIAWQALNLGNPANPLLTLQYLSQYQILGETAIAPGGDYEKTFNEYQWLPAQAGALTIQHPVFKNNTLFKTNLSASLLPPKPLYHSYKIWNFHKNGAQSVAHTDLEANLNLWLSRYREAVKTESSLKKHYMNSIKSVKSKLIKLKEATLKK
ncbi:MAG: hypothetical protein KA715_08415 [Xanthomonadaceae bacterium]|nr:hypothetical protein [Xanthomonadaceae bacterium]